jgi:excisionase family DNA binding protein
LIKKKRLEVRMEKRNGAPPIGRVNPTDVEREKGMRESREVTPHVMPPAGAVVPARSMAPVAAPALRHEWAWLTLAEAEDYIRLPASYLLYMIECNELPARDVGIRAGGRWRVKRSDLDAIQGVKGVTTP